jgi:hypothetical protein
VSQTGPIHSGTEQVLMSRQIANPYGWDQLLPAQGSIVESEFEFFAGLKVQFRFFPGS